MTNLALAERIAGLLKEATSELELRLALDEATAEMGFSYFALAQHISGTKEDGFRLHSYPEQWERYYDDRDLTVCDPVHRASQRTSIGFAWTDLAELIALTAADKRMLCRARARGLSDGFTVPAHVPGEVNGSCTFAIGTGQTVPVRALPVAQLVGAFAFEAARRIWQEGSRPVPLSVSLTDRQRDCPKTCAAAFSHPDEQLGHGGSHPAARQERSAENQDQGSQASAHLPTRNGFLGRASRSSKRR